MIFSDTPYRKTDMHMRMRTVVLLEQGVSCWEISRQLNVNVKTVYGIRKRHEETVSVADKSRSGHGEGLLEGLGMHVRVRGSANSTGLKAA